MSPHVIFGSIFCGILFSVAWWIFIDGVVTSPDAFPYIHILPALGGTVALVMINIVPISQDSFLEDNVLLKVWLFVWFTISCCSIMGSIWITSIEYPPNIKENWGGVSIILQTMLLLITTFILLLMRLQIQDTY